MGVGSYALSMLEREQLSQWNPKVITTVILKMLGERAASMNDLRTITGLPQDVLVRSLTELQTGGLIQGQEEHYRLTERGEKARFLVAS